MTYNDFKEYFDKSIQKYYDDIKFIDNKQFDGQAISLKKNRLKLVYLYYESFRKEIRKLYMSEESKPMDRHKIASNMMCSLLKAKIINVNRLIPHLPLELLLANEYIAFYCAINIVELYKSDLTKKKYCLILPPTYIDDEDDNKSYTENVCKALYYSKKFTINDIFSYANILFMLECYTDTLLKSGKEQE